MTWDRNRIVRIASGEETGAIAMGIRGLLHGLSWGYRFEVGRRNRRFDRQPSLVTDVPAPVISVGNLTTGGTGKTPVVCEIAKRIRDLGHRVAIVSRGYGRGETGSNDEAFELYQRLPDVPHVQDPDRVAAAMIAIEELESEVIVMDDGMQHRRMGRDFEITLIDATCPFGFGYVLPRGLLREPLSSLRRSNLVLLTRSDQVQEDDLVEIESKILQYQQIPILRARHRPSRLRDSSGEFFALESLQGQDVGILSAIGNPKSFRHTVVSLGANVVSERTFPDHHRFDSKAMSEIRHWVKSLSHVDRIVCTHKDLVKLSVTAIEGIPLVAIEIGMEMTDPGGCFDKALQSALDHFALRNSSDESSSSGKTTLSDGSSIGSLGEAGTPSNGRS